MKFAKFLPLFFISLLGGECSIDVNYKQLSDGSTILNITHSKNCKMSISLTEDGSSIKFSPKTSKKALKTESKTQTLGSSKDSLIDNIIKTAKNKVGSRYNPGSAGPDKFDCSGFVYYVFKQNGIKIPRVSTKQAQIGKKLKRDELKKGDIVCFDTAKRGRINHTGIYLGDGKFIHSTSGRAYSVTVSNLDKGFYKEKFRWGVRVVK